MDLDILFPVDFDTLRPRNPYVLQMLQFAADAPGVGHVGFGAGMLKLFGQNWDIIHFQWPEASLGWRKPSEAELSSFRERIIRWRMRGARIVCTIHNSTPRPDFGRMGPRLYEIVYGEASALVHLGEESVQEFAGRYGKRSWFTGARHLVIPHPDYEFYADAAPDPSLLQALESLHRPRFLVFGRLRSAEEEALAREAFLRAGLPGATMVFAGDFEPRAFPKTRRRAIDAASPPNIVRHARFIAQDDIPAYFRNAEFLFLPRVGRLNSGVQALANTFGLPVIGPDGGVLGGVLKSSGGLSYAPGSIESAAQAIHAAAELSADRYDALRAAAAAYRASHMTTAAAGERHLALYRELLAKPA